MAMKKEDIEKGKRLIEALLKHADINAADKVMQAISLCSHINFDKDNTSKRCISSDFQCKRMLFCVCTYSIESLFQ